MLNDIQAVDSDRSTLAKFADDLTLSGLVKGTQDRTPRKVENLPSWAQSNLMTLNLTETKEMVVKAKLKDLSPLLRLILNRKYFRRFTLS